jgi:hypothetical protein
LIDWLENLPRSPFVWPDSVETKIETATTRKFGSGDDGITLFGKDTGHSSSRAAAKITVAGAEIYVCALRRRDDDDLVKPGCIIYAGAPDDEFRKRARTAVSFALGVYLVDLGNTVYSKDWEIVSLTSCSAYSIDRKALDLAVLPPAPLGMRWQHEIDPLHFIRLVNAIFQNYEALDFGNLSWAYCHALCGHLPRLCHAGIPDPRARRSRSLGEHQLGLDQDTSSPAPILSMASSRPRPMRS